jgi:hypothetical protein
VDARHFRAFLGCSLAIITSLLKTLLKLFVCTASLLFAWSNFSYADGGFPVRPGRLLISPSASYFFSSSKWDSAGVKAPFAKNGKYTSFGITLLAEYGINKRFAVVATLPYVVNSYRQDDYKNTSTGLTDVETGLRYYLANINFIYYFSLQATAITPLYSNTALGYAEEGGELKLALSGTGRLFNRSTYFNVFDGVRQYFGTDGPIQNRYNGTFGITLDKMFANQVAVTLSGINSVSNNKSFSPVLNSDKDYSFLQASVSYGHSFTREASLFISGGKFLTGRNTADGASITLAFIYRLDYR